MEFIGDKEMNNIPEGPVGGTDVKGLDLLWPTVGFQFCTW